VRGGVSGGETMLGSYDLFMAIRVTHIKGSTYDAAANWTTPVEQAGIRKRMTALRHFPHIAPSAP